MNRHYELLNEALSKHTPTGYHISGLVIGALGPEYNSILSKYKLEIREVLRKDPWIGIAGSKPGTFIEKSKVGQLAREYQHDPDGKGIPYYFVAIDCANEKNFVIFNDDFKMIPINTIEERVKAKHIGISKGLDPDHVSFDDEKEYDKATDDTACDKV